VILATATPWAPAGHVLVHNQLALPPPPPSLTSNSSQAPACQHLPPSVSTSSGSASGLPVCVPALVKRLQARHGVVAAAGQIQAVASGPAQPETGVGPGGVHVSLVSGCWTGNSQAVVQPLPLCTCDPVSSNNSAEWRPQICSIRMYTCQYAASAWSCQVYGHMLCCPCTSMPWTMHQSRLCPRCVMLPTAEPRARGHHCDRPRGLMVSGSLCQEWVPHLPVCCCWRAQ
jgi:hypothetical protein